MWILGRPGRVTRWIGALVTAGALSTAASELRDGCRAAPLFPDPVFAVGVNPNAVAAGDFDRDGFEDLVVANAGSDDLSLLFGTGDGDFRAETRVAIGQGVSDVVAADFNGDGAPDLAVVRTRANDVAVLLNDGHGGFSGATHLTVGLAPFRIVTADFNEDAVIDLAVGNSGDISILLGLGDGQFKPEQRVSVTGSSLTLVSADFDGDRHADLLVADGFGNGTLLTGTGKGGFIVGPPFFFGQAESISASDLDGDGRADTVATDFSSDRVVIKASVAGQGFVFRGAIATVAGPHTVKLVDYNRDGFPDLVVAGNGGLSVAAGHGGFVFDSAVNIDTGGFNTGVAVTTFDGNELPDVAIADDLANTVSLILNPASRPPGASSRFAAGDSPLSLALADLDGDGHLDAVVVNEASNDVSVLRGRGDGTFEPQMRIVLAGIDPTDVRVADFNRDGALDLAVQTAREIDVFTGRGDGTFQEAVRYPLGFFAFRMAAADLTGDGIVDLVAAGQESTGVDHVAVFRGLEDGTFAQPTIMDFLGLSNFLAAADLNGDGVIDLALALPYSNAVCVLPGTGGGTFGPQSNLPAGVFPYSVAAADFNRDGLVDLASANNTGNVAVLMNTGEGQFSSPAFLPVGQSSSILATGDLDGDGVIDLAVANGSSNDVSVLIGLGDGTFKPERRFRAGGGPQYLAFGDLNEDGLADIVTANLGSDDISVLLNLSPVNHPPIADAGPDIVTECTSPAGALVRLDGSGSHDPDSVPARDDIVSYEWAEIVGSTEVPLASGRLVDVTLAPGRHDIVLRVTDRAGASSTDQVAVTVESGPPVLSVTLSPALLWPPNHRMVDVTASVTVKGTCSEATVVLESITSNEPDDAPGGGDGNTVDDIQGAAPGALDLEFSLRAERDARGSGRIYTIVYRAVDSAGIMGRAAMTVIVPLTRASVTDPLTLLLSNAGPADTVIEWTPVQDAAAYRVARGDLGNVTIDSAFIRLGPLACLASSTSQTSLAIPAETDTPDLGRAFFYVVEYLAGAWSSYGTDTALLPRIGSDDCP